MYKLSVDWSIKESRFIESMWFTTHKFFTCDVQIHVWFVWMWGRIYVLFLSNPNLFSLKSSQILTTNSNSTLNCAKITHFDHLDNWLKRVRNKDFCDLRDLFLVFFFSDNYNESNTYISFSSLYHISLENTNLAPIYLSRFLGF